MSEYEPIENYGVIGDLHTVALVSNQGSIDFLSFPRFDSPTIFAKLLDHRRGGCFSISPCLPNGRWKQMYLPDTNVLITRWLSAAGVAEVSDFMPVGIHPDEHPRVLIRRLKCVRGKVAFDVKCSPRFDYGRADHRIEQEQSALVFRSSATDRAAFRLRYDRDVGVLVVGLDAEVQLTLGEGETATFVLEEVGPGIASPASDPDYCARAFRDTVNFWRSWLGQSSYQGRWREIVHRSALVLKLLTSQTHGSLIAAATFGLPEQLGGARNWDYRYTWIRDASFTLYALIRLGFTDEAHAFTDWIVDRCMHLNPDGSLRTIYRHDGHALPVEETLEHFEGYAGSAPVRIGNAADDQLQLDIYGELMDAVYLQNKYGDPISSELWENLVRLVDYVCANWRLADECIWEVRGGRQEFLYSRLMCWVAVDRGIRLADRRSLPSPRERWHDTRDAIYRSIFTEFWDEGRQTFVQHRGATGVDAALLLMPMVKFVSPSDPRWRSTLDVIGRELVDDSLVFRYRQGEAAHDGFAGDEGTFTMCSFWYCEALARSGDVQKARFLFDKMLGYANHLGLYAEELGPHGEHLGNFPQAFTHLALISAAYTIDRELSDAGWIA